MGFARCASDNHKLPTWRRRARQSTQAVISPIGVSAIPGDACAPSLPTKGLSKKYLARPLNRCSRKDVDKPLF
jgi:hypothetical protein